MELELDDALLTVLTDIDVYLQTNDYDRIQDAAADSAATLPKSTPLSRFLEEGGEDGGENENLPPLEELLVNGDMVELLSVPATTPQITATELPPLSLSAQHANFHSMQVAAVPRKRTKASNTTGKRMITWDPNKARKERMAELINLRKMATELETQVTELKANKQIQTGNSASQSPRVSGNGSLLTKSLYSQQQSTIHTQQLKFTIPVHVTSSSPEMYAWQKIAKRQSVVRAKSERENIRLKFMLENQLKIALNLEKRFKRAVAIAELETCRSQGCNDDVNTVGNFHACGVKARTTTDIFKDLLAGVEQCYAEVDSVLASSGLACSVLTSMVAKMRPDCDRRLFLEVCSTKALPFDMHATASAVWNHYVHAKERIPFRHYSYNTPKVGFCLLSKSTDPAEDTIVESFNLGVEINRKLAKFCIKQITRRYVEATRVVIVWCATFAPIEFLCESLSGVRFLEKGYVVITHPSLRPDGLTLLQTCYIVKPLSAGDGLDNDNPHLAAITEFLLSSKELNISVSDQMIENELLQQALSSNADAI
ncbi:hypothetical protein FI667_g11733, partial [Globisporangium splendens]